MHITLIAVLCSCFNLCPFRYNSVYLTVYSREFAFPFYETLHFVVACFWQSVKDVHYLGLFHVQVGGTGLTRYEEKVYESITCAEVFEGPQPTQTVSLLHFWQCFSISVYSTHSSIKQQQGMCLAFLWCNITSFSHYCTTAIAMSREECMQGK